MGEYGIDGELRTDAGYAGESKKNGALTPAAEDYLEMICRLSGVVSEEQGRESPVTRPVRIGELAEKLRVSPSSASRMAQSMALWGYVDFRRYGYITVTEKGKERGAYLLRRHAVVREFLESLTGEDALVETERIEHHLSENTVAAMEKRNKQRAADIKSDEMKSE